MTSMHQPQHCCDVWTYRTRLLACSMNNLASVEPHFFFPWFTWRPQFSLERYLTLMFCIPAFRLTLVLLQTWGTLVDNHESHMYFQNPPRFWCLIHDNLKVICQALAQLVLAEARVIVTLKCLPMLTWVLTNDPLPRCNLPTCPCWRYSHYLWPRWSGRCGRTSLQLVTFAQTVRLLGPVYHSLATSPFTSSSLISVHGSHIVSLVWYQSQLCHHARLPIVMAHAMICYLQNTPHARKQDSGSVVPLNAALNNLLLLSLARFLRDLPAIAYELI